MAENTLNELLRELSGDNIVFNELQNQNVDEVEEFINAQKKTHYFKSHTTTHENC